MHPSEARVTAVVVNLNGGDLVKDAVRSLVDQDYGALTVVLVDNGSQDGSAEAVEEAFPQVEVIRLGENTGFGGANNVAMARAMERGEDYIFLLNYDAYAARSCLRVLVQAAAETGAGMVGPKIFYHHDPTLIWSAGGTICWWTGRVAHRGLRRRNGRYERRARVDYLTACALLVDTRVLRAVGLFDPAFHPAYFEDTDLCVRARRAGWTLLYEPKAHVWHRVSSHLGGPMSSAKVRLRVRHHLRFLRRHARWYHWLTIPPSLAAMAGAWAVVAAGGGRGRPALAALEAAVQDLLRVPSAGGSLRRKQK